MRSDSRFFQAWTLATELVLLNLLMVATGLPVITLGAVLTAGFVSCIHLVTGRSGRPLREYLQAFKRAFVPATVLWLATAAFVALLIWEWLVVGQLASSTLALVFRSVLLLAALLLAIVSVWVWPLLARRIINDEPMTIAGLPPLLRSALLAGIRHLPRSLAASVVVAIPLALAAISPLVGARVIIWFVIIGLSLACYLITLILRVPLGIELPDDSVDD